MDGTGWAGAGWVGRRMCRGGRSTVGLHHKTSRAHAMLFSPYVKWRHGTSWIERWRGEQT